MADMDAYKSGEKSRDPEITALKAQIVELQAWNDLACRMYLTKEEQGEIHSAIFAMKFTAGIAQTEEE